MASIVVTPATGQALELADVKQQCRIDGSHDDTYLSGIVIPAVCGLFETEVKCRLLTTVMEDTLPSWPTTGRVDLAWGPVQSVASVKYLDTAGLEQTLGGAAYQADLTARPAALYAAPGAALPPMQSHPAALRVRYTAGFGADASAIPHNVRLWLLLHVAHFYTNREAAGADLKPLPFAEGLIGHLQRAAI